MNSTSLTRLTAFIALAYALLGAAGLSLATSSGYATPVFPAAGLALVCMLWFGRRAMLGIWLGAAFVNLLPAWLNGTLSQNTMMLALMIATGATAQACAGRLLVKRWLGTAWRELEREQDAFGFLLTGGVLACVLSASFGVTGLYAAGIIGRPDFLFTWWNWYVGDVVGVFVFAPLTLSLLNTPSGSWGDRPRQIIVPMLLTLGLVILAFYGADRWERQAQDRQLQVDGEALEERITDRLITHREVLSSLRNFISVTPDFTFHQFEQFTSITLQENRDIFALSFNDLITDDRRQAFEQRMSRLSPLRPFQITERDSQRRLVRAASRPEYVAVRNIVPLAGNGPAVGYDIHSEPIRHAAIERARASKSIAVTTPVQLVQDQINRAGILEILPVYGTPTAGAKNRSGHLLGFAVAVVKIDEMIAIATRDWINAGLDFQLTDPLAPDRQGLLYRSYSQEAGNTAPAARTANWKTSLRMGDRNWELSVYTTAVYRQQHRSLMAWAVGVAGLLIATVLQILLLGMTGRTAMILRKNEEILGMSRTLEEKVTERTGQLSEANSQLTEEVNEHRHTELALQVSEARVRAITDSAHDAILMMDPNGNISYWNAAAERIFGYVRNEAIGKNLHQFIALQRYRPAHNAAYRGFQKTGQGDIVGTTLELQANCKNGSEITIELSVSSLHLHDGWHAVGVLRDVTNRKQAEAELLFAKEKAELASMAKDDLISNVSHELRTPLASIIGFTSTIREDKDLPEEMRDEFLGIVLVESRRLSTLIDDLLDVSRIESGRIELHPGTHEAAKLFEALRPTFQSLFDKKGVKLIIPNPEENMLITCDLNRMNQVLQNLLSNALKFTPAGGSVFVGIEMRGNEELEITVKDTGLGIPENDIPFIFEKFYRGKHPGVLFGGTGLGLAIAKTIIDQHGGSIRVESAGGEGSVFHVTLPRHASG